MIRVQAQSNLDHLTHLENILLDRQLVLNGVFKEEVARLLKVQAAAEEKLGMVDTVAAAEKARKDAEAYATATRAAADKTAASAGAALASANAKMDAALTKEKSVVDRENQALSVMADYHAKADAFETDCAKREAALAIREAALSAGQAKLAADAAQLSEQRRATLEKLEAAKALASA